MEDELPERMYVICYRDRRKKLVVYSPAIDFGPLGFVGLPVLLDYKEALDLATNRPDTVGIFSGPDKDKKWEVYELVPNKALQ